MQIVKILLLSFMIFMFNSCGTNAPTDTLLVNKKNLLVPLYSYPYSSDTWDQLVTLKQKYPSVDIVAIVNQSNGDFTEANDSFIRGIKSLSSVGIQVIGYVATLTATRPIEDVKANIDAWVKFYKQYGLKGFFFDEVSSKYDENSNNKSNFIYYKELSNYAKGKGCGVIVLNPGAVVNDIYMSSGIASIIVIRETTYDNVNKNTEFFNKPTATTKLGLLIHSSNGENIVTNVDDFATKYQFDYIYATDHGLTDDRWKELSSYLEALLSKML